MKYIRVPFSLPTNNWPIAADVARTLQILCNGHKMTATCILLLIESAVLLLGQPFVRLAMIASPLEFGFSLKFCKLMNQTILTQ